MQLLWRLPSAWRLTAGMRDAIDAMLRKLQAPAEPPVTTAVAKLDMNQSGSLLYRQAAVSLLQQDGCGARLACNNLLARCPTRSGKTLRIGRRAYSQARQDAVAEALGLSMTPM